MPSLRTQDKSTRPPGGQWRGKQWVNRRARSTWGSAARATCGAWKAGLQACPGGLSTLTRRKERAVYWASSVRGSGPGPCLFPCIPLIPSASVVTWPCLMQWAAAAHVVDDQGSPSSQGGGGGLGPCFSSLTLFSHYPRNVLSTSTKMLSRGACGIGFFLPSPWGWEIWAGVRHLVDKAESQQPGRVERRKLAFIKR